MFIYQNHYFHFMYQLLFMSKTQKSIHIIARTAEYSLMHSMWSIIPAILVGRRGNQKDPEIQHIQVLRFDRESWCGNVGLEPPAGGAAVLRCGRLQGLREEREVDGRQQEGAGILLLPRRRSVAVQAERSLLHHQSDRGQFVLYEGTQGIVILIRTLLHPFFTR